MTFDKEFKDAICQLPSAEKDKLLVRLLKRDIGLANRLYFELISTQSVEDKRSEMEDIVKKRIQQMRDRFYNIGYLTMDLRFLSGEITEHVQTTKDKIGEVSLNLLMLNEALKINTTAIANSSAGKAHKICIYIIARAFKLLVLIKAMHEDYLVEFREDLEQLAELIGGNHHLMKTAIYNGFDVNWLFTGIPDDIKARHTAIRKAGFLK